jgi:hypothetical protein
VNQAEVIVLNKSANISETIPLSLQGKKSAVLTLKWDWRCQMGCFKNIPELPLKLTLELNKSESGFPE